MEKHLAVKITLRRINLQRNVVKRSMTASTTDTSATKPSGRRWLRWDALKRSSKKWISLQVRTTLTKPLKKRLTYIVAIGGSTQMWHTSIRYQQGTNLTSKRRCRQCTASSKRRTRRNRPHGHTIPPLLLGNGMQAGGSPILSTRLKDGMTTDSTGQPVPWWFDIYLRKEFQHAENSEFLSWINRLQLTAVYCHRRGGVNGIHPAPDIHEHFMIYKWLRQTAYILTHNLNKLDHIANNCMNTTMHTDANIAQFWARCAPSLDALHSCVHTVTLAQVSSVCLHFHPWSSACALVLECSLHPVSLLLPQVLLPPLPESCHGAWRDFHGRSPVQLQLREHGQPGLCHTRHMWSTRLWTFLEDEFQMVSVSSSCWFNTGYTSTSVYGGFYGSHCRKLWSLRSYSPFWSSSFPVVVQRPIPFFLATMQIPQLYVDKASTTLRIWQTLVRSSPVEYRIMDFSGRWLLGGFRIQHCWFNTSQIFTSVYGGFGGISINYFEESRCNVRCHCQRRLRARFSKTRRESLDVGSLYQSFSKRRGTEIDAEVPASLTRHRNDTRAADGLLNGWQTENVEKFGSTHVANRKERHEACLKRG